MLKVLLFVISGYIVMTSCETTLLPKDNDTISVAVGSMRPVQNLLMDTTEVTEQQFADIMGYPEFTGEDAYPVRVWFPEVVEYCNLAFLNVTFFPNEGFC